MRPAATPGRAGRGPRRRPPRPGRTSRAGAGGSAPGWPGSRARADRSAARSRPCGGELAEDPVAHRVGDRAQHPSGRGRGRDSGVTGIQRTTNCARTIAQLLLRNICCGYDRLPRPSPATSDFTVLWIGQAVSELGSRVSMFVFPLRRLRAHRLGAAGRRSPMAAYLLGHRARPAAGRRAGRPVRPAPADAGRQRLRACSLYGSLAVAGIAGRAHPAAPGGGGAAHRRGAGVFAPAEMSAVRSRRDPARSCRPRSARTRPASHVASLLGGPLGGRAVRRHRAGCRSLVDAVTFAVSFVTARPDPHRPLPRRPGPQRRVRAELAEGLRYLLAPAVLPGPAGVRRAQQPGRQRAVLRRDPAAHRGRRPPGRDRPGRGPGRRRRASSARWPRRRHRPAAHRLAHDLRSPGASCRCWCRWCSGTRRCSSARCSCSACSSTRPATPARRPTASRSPRRSCRAGSSRRCSSSPCPRCRSRPIAGGFLLETYGGPPPPSACSCW